MRSFEHTHLRTPRLLLRPLGEDDVPALFSIFSDPKVMRYWSTTPWESDEPARELLAQDAAGLPAGEYLRLGLERIDDGALIGTVTLFSFREACRRAEVGYALASSAWGSGLMREALTALLDHAFDDLGLNRVEADVDPRNEASLGILERLGFRREGYLRERWIVGGEVCDSVVLGLLAREWRARRRGDGAPTASPDATP